MRKILLLLMLTISLSLSATSKDTLNAVTMVSYEQGVGHRCWPAQDRPLQSAG